MSKAAPVWTPDELRQMQEDWRRTDHNLGQVAELHACTRADVVEALGLTEADLKPRQKKKYPSWETQNPEKAAEFVRLLAGGAGMTEACKAVGIKNTNTGYVIYNRIRERNALMSNEEKIVTAVAQAIQPPAADQPEPVRPEDYTVDKPAAPAKSKKTARALEWLAKKGPLSSSATSQKPGSDRWDTSTSMPSRSILRTNTLP